MIDCDPLEFWSKLIGVLDGFDMADLAERGWSGDKLARIYFYILERESKAKHADSREILIG